MKSYQKDYMGASKLKDIRFFFVGQCVNETLHRPQSGPGSVTGKPPDSSRKRLHIKGLFGKLIEISYRRFRQ